MLALFIDGPLAGKTASIMLNAKMGSYIHKGDLPAIYRAYRGDLGNVEVILYSAEEPAPDELEPPAISAALRHHFDAPQLLSILAGRETTDLSIGD